MKTVSGEIFFRLQCHFFADRSVVYFVLLTLTLGPVLHCFPVISKVIFGKEGSACDCTQPYLGN